MKEALDKLLGNITQGKPVTTIGTEVTFSQESLLMSISIIVIAIVLIILVARLTK